MIHDIPSVPISDFENTVFGVLSITLAPDIQRLRDDVRIFGEKCRSIIHVLKRDCVFFQRFMDSLQTLLNDTHMQPHKLADLTGPFSRTDKGLDWTSPPAIRINTTIQASQFIFVRYERIQVMLFKFELTCTVEMSNSRISGKISTGINLTRNNIIELIDIVWNFLKNCPLQDASDPFFDFALYKRLSDIAKTPSL